MNKLRLLQRILLDFFGILIGLGALLIYYLVILKELDISNFVSVFWIIVGLFVLSGIIIGLFSFSIDFYFTLGAVCLSLIITDMVRASDILKGVYMNLFLGRFPWIFYGIISLSISLFFVLGGFIGIWIKIFSSRFVARNKEDFARKITIPEKLIAKYVVKHDKNLNEEKHTHELE
ncbi:MAG: hypothetical protein ACXABK_00190 [Candidatus Heimdallarchaeaceae archaeon]|jgi:hypothetical protein